MIRISKGKEAKAHEGDFDGIHVAHHREGDEMRRWENEREVFQNV